MQAKMQEIWQNFFHAGEIDNKVGMWESTTHCQFIEVVEIWIWSKSVFTRHKQKKAIKKTKENVCHLNISKLQPWDAIKISQTNLQWLRKTLNEEPCHPINANWRKWRMFENVLIKKRFCTLNFSKCDHEFLIWLVYGNQDKSW